jgi:hypothetical protein
MGRRVSWADSSGNIRLLPVPIMLVASFLSLTSFTAGLEPHEGRVSAQAEPTATNIPLVFNTPAPDSDSDSTNTPRAQEPAAQDELELSADAWEGGYFRGDSAYYGRPWTAIYGAQSDYPRVTLVVSLRVDPAQPIELAMSGLDDELPDKNQIVVEINGQRIYQGESWFANWDGDGTGEDAAWTMVRITIPPGLLIQGDNRITIRNATASANFGSPPYVLLDSVTVTSSEPALFGAAPDPRVTIVIEHPEANK